MQQQKPWSRGETVILHFFGSSSGERGTVVAVSAQGVPTEFTDRQGNKIFPTDLVHFHRPNGR